MKQAPPSTNASDTSDVAGESGGGASPEDCSLAVPVTVGATVPATRTSSQTVGATALGVVPTFRKILETWTGGLVGQVAIDRLGIVARMDDLRSRLIGVWRVTRYDDRGSTDAPWTPSYGADVDGLIVYDESGWLSVSVAGAGRFDAYFGRFEIIESSMDADDVVGIVNHEIVATSMPELLAIDQSRPFRVNDRTLVLGDGETWRRVCERVSDVGRGQSPGWRREWDSNPRWVAPHTLSKRADSAALASLPGGGQGILAV